MKYNVEFKLNGNIVSQSSQFISKKQILTIRLNTNNKNIRNVKVVLNNEEFYMTKINGIFSIDLYQNMVNVGKNSISFIIEEKYKQDTETNSLFIDITDDNFFKEDFDYIKYLISTLNKILTKISKE